MKQEWKGGIQDENGDWHYLEDGKLKKIEPIRPLHVILDEILNVIYSSKKDKKINGILIPLDRSTELLKQLIHESWGEFNIASEEIKIYGLDVYFVSNIKEIKVI